MAGAAVGHRWQPIADVGDADRASASTELPALAKVWAQVRQTLDEQQVSDFIERLKREWAIETGVIERLYTLNRRTAGLLIEQGVDGSRLSSGANDELPGLVIGMIRDHTEAVDCLEDAVTDGRSLSAAFLKELHQIMTRRQTHTTGVTMFGTAREVRLRHGTFRRRSNNPVLADGARHEYCPPEHIDAEVDRLLEMHHSHEVEGLPPDVSAAWILHRFVQIHPFDGGNGRVARAVASLALMDAGWYPLVVTRRDRDRYVRALMRADEGDLTDLISLVGVLEGKCFRNAITLARDVVDSRPQMDQLMSFIGDMFSSGESPGQAEPHRAIGVAKSLHQRCAARFMEVRDQLHRLIGSRTDAGVWSDAATDDDPQRRNWFRHQVVQTARGLDYFANRAIHHEWARLILQTESGRSEILASFHGIGREYRGLLGVSMCFYRKQAAEPGPAGGIAETHAPRAIELQTVTTEVFQINHMEEPASVERRFEQWLERGLIGALDQWRRGE